MQERISAPARLYFKKGGRLIIKVLYYDESVKINDCYPRINLYDIANSGQCFRWKELSPNEYAVVAFDKLLIIKQDHGIELMSNAEDFSLTWRNYLDLDYDYESVLRVVQDPEDYFLRSASKFSSGIRILNQDPWECLISFIISQQNNIPRIIGIIDRLCMRCGDVVGEYNGELYYSFPTAEQIMDHYLELRDIGVGFRDKYILDACRKINAGYDLNRLRDLSAEDTIKELKSFYGVGDKVANCISLFGLGHKEAFPRDVWINRIIDKYYSGEFDTSRFAGFSGVIQQYMFYYERSISHGND